MAQHNPSRAEFGLSGGAFVFCCFNGPQKINAPVFDTWMHVLTAVPGSMLWLAHSNKWAAGNLRKEAQMRGVDPRAARLQAATELRRSPRRAEVGRSFFGYLALQRAHDRKRCTVGGLAGVDLLRTLLCCARCGELAVRDRDAGARNTLA